ncbi:MAG: hypothetical protein KC996_04795 [Phycisphaerales bacterium]|nr:hypothetical protein [Phycisphaerales bacterium]
MNNSTNKPFTTLRDGSIAATIWKNPTQRGFRYSVNLSRVYQDEQGNLKDSDSFSGNELLRVSRLAQKAYDEVLAAMQADKKQAGASES